MNAKEKDRAVTAIVIILVAALMISIVWIIWSFSNGDISEDSMIILSSVMSSGLFIVVIIYAVIVERSMSKAERYKTFLQEQHRKEFEEKHRKP